MAAGSMRPGMAYEDMYELICAAKPPGADMIGNELLIAIFWEESLFNNIEQRGGTAWGFGQVEPLEMRHVETEEARLRGYYVMGLPPRNVIKRDENGVPIQARLGGALSPDQSVQVSAGVLCHYYYNVSHTMKGALEAYGGVRYAGKDVPAHVATAGDRLKIIEGWRDCEAYLKKEWRPKPVDKKPPNPLLPDYESDYPSFIKSALKKARSFDVNNKEFDDILFPKNSVNEAGQRAWRPQRTPYWLMNAAMRGYR